MSVPTRGETFSKLIEYIRLAQEQAAMMAHLENAENDYYPKEAFQWLTVSELLKKMQHQVTNLATRGRQ